MAISSSYHQVKQSHEVSSKDVKSTVLDGTFGPAEITSLRAILDTPELKDRVEEKPQKAVKVILGPDSFSTHLSIPRNGKVQGIAVWKANRVVGGRFSQSMEEHGARLLDPLRVWLKSHLDDAKAAPSFNPQNARCSPEG